MTTKQTREIDLESFSLDNDAAYKVGKDRLTELQVELVQVISLSFWTERVRYIMPIH